jgi:hypothetical protein
VSSRYQLNWLDHCATLNVPEKWLAEAAAQFTGLQLKAAPADAKDDIIALERTGYYEVQFGDIALRCETEDDLLVNVATLVPAHFFSITSAQPALHAGALLHKGEAILFSGDPYCGKSTLAYNAWQLGEDVIGDDWLLYDTENFNVKGFPKPIKPRVDPEQLPEMPKSVSPQQSVLGKLHNEWRLMISRQAGFVNSFETPYHIRSLFFISRETSPFSRVESIDRELALKQILSQTLLTKSRMSLPGIKLLDHLWKVNKVFLLHIGEDDFERAVELMKSTE